MKFNKYQLVAAGIAVAILVIVVFTQRSDWDANKFILSADGQGNLEPKSEKYFENQEKKLLSNVDTKLNNQLAEVGISVAAQKKKLDFLSSLYGDRHTQRSVITHGPMLKPGHPGINCYEGVLDGKCKAHAHYGCARAITCPFGTVAVKVDTRGGTGTCLCTALALPWTEGLAL